MTDEPSLEELKKNPKVLDLYRNRLQLKQQGRRWRGSCPFHNDRHATNFDCFQHEGTWIYKCLSCGEAGSILDLIRKMDNTDLKGAIKVVREYCSEWFQGREVVTQTFRSVGSNEKQAKTFSKEEYGRLEASFAQNQAAQAWLLKERGITAQTAQRLRIGYRHDVGKLAGTENAICADRGWLAFPTFDGSAVSSIKYRSISAKAFCKQPGMSTELFNLDTIECIEPVFLTEGEFDAAVLEQAFFRAVSVPSATTTIKPEWKDALLDAECVILAGDNDNGVGAKLMEKLWAEMKERTYLLRWPGTIKDANEFWDHCGRDLSIFRTKINALVNEAKSRPMDGIYSLAETMRVSEHVSLADHPHRLRMPWPSVDSMAVLLPGSVMALTATNTKQGKTQFTTQLSVHAARKHNEVVLNYQAELSTDEFANIVASHVLRRSRNRLTKDDYHEAANMLSGIKYYVGHNPTLNTIGPVLDLLEAAIRRLGATLVIVDHIHHLCRNQDNEIQVQANAMQRLKSLAQQYQCKVIVISQPRKAQQVSKGKSLHVTDIKGSETLTSDADAIFSLHREFIKVKDPDNPPRDDYEPETEVQLLGARSKGDGSTLARLQFVGDICTFSEVSYQAEPQSGLEFGK